MADSTSTTAAITPECLIQRLDAAMGLADPEEIVQRVKGELEEMMASGAFELPERLRQPSSTTYARRLLHRDLDRGYSAVVMAWAPGQGTALHDHAGTWCVECVIEGEMDVERFELLEELAGDRFRFVPRGGLRAGVGEAGALIPPFEYHVMRNPHQSPAVTLHVYGGELTSCNVFVPGEDGLHRRESRNLSYVD